MNLINHTINRDASGRDRLMRWSKHCGRRLDPKRERFGYVFFGKIGEPAGLCQNSLFSPFSSGREGLSGSFFS
jgi:hypothetical protein